MNHEETDAAEVECITLPNSAEDMSEDFMSLALGIEVDNLLIEPVGIDTGFAGSVYRIQLEYTSDDSHDFPNTLIWKTISSHQPTNRLLLRLGAYSAEAEFYGRLADGIPVAPRAYFSRFDPEARALCLLLEDIDTMTPGEQLAGCTERQAFRVVQELARLHAQFWGDSAHDTLGEIPMFDAAAELLQRMHEAAWQNLAADSSRAILSEVANRITPVVVDIERRLATPPLTLLHGDARADNMFFADGDDELRLIDWQAARIGKGAYDLAYFLAASVPTNIRRNRQSDFIRAYVDTLAACGVKSYDFAKCMEDIRWALLDIVTFFGIIGASLNFDSQRGSQLAQTMMSRLQASIEDNAALDVLA